MRISDWSSDVCSSDLVGWPQLPCRRQLQRGRRLLLRGGQLVRPYRHRPRALAARRRLLAAHRRPRDGAGGAEGGGTRRLRRSGGGSRERPSPSLVSVAIRSTSKRRSEEHTSELQSLMRISYAVFCLKKKKKRNTSPQ